MLGRMDRRLLPLFAVEEELVAAARAHGRFILQAPTGSGKSTQAPQILLDRGVVGPGRIVVLQPRRIAARLLAARVARERGGTLGAEVGYQVRFEGAWSEATRILYVTEGVLLRRLLEDPELTGVSAVLFDEFHERHLYGDITLARVATLQRERRPELRIGVMSATLDLAPLEAWLAPCATIRSEGRQYPVHIEYLPKAEPDVPEWELAARAFERLAADGLEGDVLVFMPGAYEIARAIEAIRATPAARGRLVLPLHGELPPDQQDAAVAPAPQPKVIVATNVAETSLTIEGVRAVIDSGTARVPRYDPRRGINTLLVEPISRAAADQRAGRAGRLAPGRCIRLWTEREHRARPAAEMPEIRRLDLAEVALGLKASGVEDLNAFRWFEPPPPRALERAEALLRDLGATDERGALTPLGRRMAEWPLHPRYARMLIEAGARGCVRTVALIAALTQGRGLLRRRSDRDTRAEREDRLGPATSDFFLLARAWNYARQCRFDPARCERLGIHAHACRQVGPLYDLFLRQAERAGLPIGEEAGDEKEVRKCVLAGFADHVARRLDTGTLRCALTHGRRGRLDRASAVQDAPLIVAAEISEIEGRDIEVVLSLATAIEEEWLDELFPGERREETTVAFDRATRRVVALRRRMFRGLVLDERPGGDPPPEAAAALLAEEALAGGIELAYWNEAVEQWIARVNYVARMAPEHGVPAIGPAERRAMLEQICHGGFSQKDVRERPVLPVVRGWLSAAQQALVERMAPEHATLPGGRRVRVTYPEAGDPFIAARIQDLYGLETTPAILGGRQPLTVQILGPNFRPVQITRDLAGFWRETYPKVRQELRRKYPKHEWR